jgi:hypothetical protein
LEIVSGGLLQVSSGGTLRGEGTFKLTKRIPQPDPIPDILEDFVTSDAANKRLTVLDGGTLQVDGGGTALFKATATVDVDAEFNLRQTGTNYLQWTPWNQTLTVQTGGKVSVESGATLSVAGTLSVTGTKVTDAFESSIRRGQITIATTAGGTEHPFGTGDGAVTFWRVVENLIPLGAFGQNAFPVIPKVFVTLADGRANIKQVAAINVTQSTFSLVVDDWDPPTTDVVVNWLAVT